MSTPELMMELPAQFTLSRRPAPGDEYYLGEEYTVNAPKWYVKFFLADETLLLSTGTDILEWHIDRATRQVVDAILDNPVVSEEINRRYVPKEKVREILTTPEVGDRFDVTHVKENVRRLLEEDK